MLCTEAEHDQLLRQRLRERSIDKKKGLRLARERNYRRRQVAGQRISKRGGRQRDASRSAERGAHDQTTDKRTVHMRFLFC
jgi:hypothetical protein